MVFAGGQQARDRRGLVYVTRFASHPAGVWQLSGRAPGGGGPGLAAHAVQEQRKEAAKTGAPGELRTSAQSRDPAAAASAAFHQRKLGEQSRQELAEGAGLIQKDAAKKFDFPIPLHEASKIMKKRKKVWKKVYKVIARMIAENERYRLRLRCQNLSNEIQINTR
uniref:RIKEN cDNA 4930524B15 gene n=1 Tax=Nannospalax galili TaxID=1026970 RepID=A0A8C6W5N8_NANGA